MEEARSAEPSAADRLLPIVAGPVSGINQQREITGTAIGLALTTTLLRGN
jgi:hypothetical protein